ncbi:hypothetical protein L3Q72_16120 [Vibrio sp. JC009]|uniref:hypothetical protein n=1 Tax=Vibrio sp. JC009 TaxID=2912314 RepID=UPI0023B1D2C5|nr:hypothetical protein [Vibrio sp. JC009]WED24403.1 hypothetical protein L3Q72_16120 [Vibrio sp. JC009]
MSNMMQVIRERWKTILALVLAIIAFKFNLMFVWGIFCLFWAVQNIRNREAYFVERIERDENPVLYWIVVGIWGVTGITYFFMDEMLLALIK